MKRLFKSMVVLLALYFPQNVASQIYSGDGDRMFRLPVDAEPAVQGTRMLVNVDQNGAAAGWTTWKGRTGNARQDWGGSYAGHQGTDFMADENYVPGISAPIFVVAAADGIVRSIRDGFANKGENGWESWDGRSFGNSIVIDHYNGITAVYAHLHAGSMLVELDEVVTKGQRIATMGWSGSPGPRSHLHFEVRKDASYARQHLTYSGEPKYWDSNLAGEGYYGSSSSPAVTTPIGGGGMLIDPYSSDSSKSWWINQDFYVSPANDFLVIPEASTSTGNDISPHTPSTVMRTLPDLGFDWTDVVGAIAYRIQISTNPVGWTESDGFASGIVVNAGLNSSNNPDGAGGLKSSYVWNASSVGLPHSPPVAGQQYWWTVRDDVGNRFTDPTPGGTNPYSPITAIASSILSANLTNIVSNVSSGPVNTAMTWTYTVNANQSGDVLLGAALRSSGGANYDMGTGFVKSVGSGSGSYSIAVTVPNGTPQGSYSLRGAVWRDENGNGAIDPSVDTLLSGPSNYGSFMVTGAVGSPEISVSFSGINIENGDSNPATAKGTHFGSTVVIGGTPVTRGFVISNTGNAPLSLGSASVSDAEFSIIQMPSTIPEDGTGVLAIRYTPVDTASDNAIVSFATNDNDEDPFSFAVYGNGVSSDPPIDPVSKSLPAGTGIQTYDIEVNLAGSWSVVESYNWLSVNPSSGSGSAVITVIVAPNSSASPRSGTILIGGENHILTQSGALVTLPDLVDDGEPYQQVSPLTLAAGGSIDVEFDIANNGDAASGSFQVEVYLSTDSTITSGDTLLGTVAMPGIVANNWANCDLEGVTVPVSLAPGSYYFGWIIDSGGEVVETDESNNTVLYKGGATRLTVSAPVALSVLDPDETFGAGGGQHNFAVLTSLPWTWSVDSPWVVSSEPVNQSGNQAFAYSVEENTGPDSRTAKIIFYADGGTVTHTIVQDGTLPDDDHGGNRREATVVASGELAAGNIETGGDTDYFRINVTEPSLVLAYSTGATDTFGWIHSETSTLGSDDDGGNGLNMRLVRSPLPAGAYYIEVGGINSDVTGQYGLVVKVLPVAKIRITSITPRPDLSGVRLDFSKAEGWVYRLQYSDNGMNWTTFLTYGESDSGDFFVNDTGRMNDFDELMYRIAIFEQ